MGGRYEALPRRDGALRGAIVRVVALVCRAQRGGSLAEDT
eukprot:gene1615-9947_t